jgi:hypothetical protein
MEPMSFASVLAAIAIIGFGAAQYTLMYNAIRDLLRRSRVRGGNKVLWGLVILCLPILGALMYSWMGPTSLLSRQPRTILAQSFPSAPPEPERSRPANITPITSAPSARRTRSPRSIHTRDTGS